MTDQGPIMTLYRKTVKPSRYRGTTFRSQLEASWACLFDKFDWVWQYEPGRVNGYLPDFLLHMLEPVLVEVKPYGPEFLAQAQSRIENSNYRGHIILIVNMILDGPSIGWYRRPDGNWTPAPIGLCPFCHKETFLLVQNCAVCGRDCGPVVSFAMDTDSKLTYRTQYRYDYYDTLTQDYFDTKPDAVKNV